MPGRAIPGFVLLSCNRGREWCCHEAVMLLCVVGVRCINFKSNKPTLVISSYFSVRRRAITMMHTDTHREAQTKKRYHRCCILKVLHFEIGEIHSVSLKVGHHLQEAGPDHL